MQDNTSGFSVALAREIVSDLFEHCAATYWFDFLVTMAVGYTAAAIYFAAPLLSVVQITAYFVAGFALFRLGSFIHEIVHMSGRELLWFRRAWNLLAGVPMLMPSFFYMNHIDHHSTKHYGTGQDGEYLPLGSGALREIGYFFLQVVFLPMAIFLRFAVITPLSFVFPKLRIWALERASSFVINLRYRHRIPRNAPLKSWAILEGLCAIRAWAIPLCVALGLTGIERLPALYMLAVLTLGLNYIRNVVAHRYASSGHPMSHLEQLEDSVNFEGVPIITELFFPLNLRYHALHHLLPTLPYHNLGKAHRRLLAALPAQSVYHRALYPGFWSVLSEVVTRAIQTGSLPPSQQKSNAWYAHRERLLDTRYGSARPPEEKSIGNPRCA